MVTTLTDDEIAHAVKGVPVDTLKRLIRCMPMAFFQTEAFFKQLWEFTEQRAHDFGFFFRVLETVRSEGDFLDQAKDFACRSIVRVADASGNTECADLARAFMASLGENQMQHVFKVVYGDARMRSSCMHGENEMIIPDAVKAEVTALLVQIGELMHRGVSGEEAATELMLCIEKAHSIMLEAFGDHNCHCVRDVVRDASMELQARRGEALGSIMQRYIEATREVQRALEVMEYSKERLRSLGVSRCSSACELPTEAIAVRDAAVQLYRTRRMVCGKRRLCAPAPDLRRMETLSLGDPAGPAGPSESLGSFGSFGSFKSRRASM